MKGKRGSRKRGELMSLVVAAPPRGELQPAAWMERAAAHSIEETRGYHRAACEALVARFDSATARGVATIVPPQTTVDKNYLDGTGFQRPLVAKTPVQVDLLVPAPNALSLDALAAAIGPERPVRAIDVATQQELAKDWKLKQWMAYFATPATKRDRVLNLISLECSGTKLQTLVRAPKVVREIGWVERHWVASAPKKDKLAPPKVALYCLMSAAGSYTEFHIDFGGSSVWYHLYQGRKFFFVIPPTDANLASFAQYEGKYQHGHAPFFGDLVARGECSVIEMLPGDTLLLPSGWIHAVYTPEDSISFGGNFLSSYHMTSHLYCHRQELLQNVERRFLFPEFESAVWYAAVYYGKMLSTCPSLLTKWEWLGLRDLVPALDEWLTTSTTDPVLVARVTGMCKMAVHATPSAMLAKMRTIVADKMKLFHYNEDDLEKAPRTNPAAAPPIASLSRGAAGHSSSSSSESSPESSSESSDSSSDDSDDDNGHESDHDRQPTDDDGNANDDNSNSSDSSSDDDSSSSSSSSDEDDNDERKEAEDIKEPEQEKEAEEEGELDEPEESSSSESENDDDPDPESAYPELPPVPIESLIAIRKQAKLKDFQITKAGKDQVVALAHQHRMEAQHPSKKKKAKTGGAVVAGATVITPWAEEDRWTVACSCGLGGENYDDGRMMVECNNCNNWVHGECVRIPIQEIFWCFKCRSPESNDWLFVCPCGIKQKNYDDGARMVQCDNCEIWQHTYCAGIPDTEDPPEKFNCKICSKMPKKPKTAARVTQKRTKKKGSTTKSKQVAQSVGALSAFSTLAAVAVDTAPASTATVIPTSPPNSPSADRLPPPPPPPPPSAPPSPTPAVDSIDEEAYSPPKPRKRGRPAKSKSKEPSRKRTDKEDPTGTHDIPPSPAGVHGVSVIVQRPPLPSPPKASSKPGKRKSSGGSARDRLEKKLKTRKPRA